MGQIRIIAGQWRSRRIPVAERPGLRPTADRARETLFNWLNAWLPWDWEEVDVLDGYAGSGALGLEAASRGAASVTLVESDPAVALGIDQSLSLLKAPASVRLLRGRFLDQGQLPGSPFALVFLDPPFGLNLLRPSLQAVITQTRPEALVYVESEAGWPLDLPEAEQANWEVLRATKTGRSFQTLIQKR
nr:Ribosomal RNA small subunit methyltransferase D [Cupriavidus sp.]